MENEQIECPNCHESNGANATFCNYCGAKLEKENIANSESSENAQQKQLAVRLLVGAIGFIVVTIVLFSLFGKGCGCVHEWKETSNTATCTTSGVKTFECEKCQETRKQDSPQSRHDFAGTKCKVCNLTVTSTWSTDTDCLKCGKVNIIGDNKTYYRQISTSATCTTDGVAYYICPKCYREFYAVEKALGHDYKITKDEATCQQDGNTYYACARKDCAVTKTEFSEASSSKHKWVETYSKETVQYEYTDYKCSVCNETKTTQAKVSMGTALKNTEEKFYYATGAAVQIVKGRLKYPSSAKFLDESKMIVHYNYATGNYFIEGAVSAPNAFGVYTDYYFIVKTKIRVSGDKFTWYDYDCVLE